MTDGGSSSPAGAPSRQPDRLPTWAPVGLLFVSGAIALVYESLWMRAFTSLFGATAPAAAITVSALFAGLALGSAWFGRRAPRASRPLRLYAALEIVAALTALATLWLVKAYAELAPALHARFASAPALLLALKALLASAALLAPSFFLGGTLPVLTEVVDDRRGRGGLRSSHLYAANTLGGVAGALAVPFLLLPGLGAARSYLVAVVLNLALGAAGIGLDLLTGARPARERASVPPSPAVAPATSPRGPLGLAFASGFLALGLEVVWMRMLSQVHPNSTHAFSIVLAVFLAALFAGACLGTRLARGGGARLSSMWIAAGWIAAGIFTLAAPLVFVWATGGLDYIAGSNRNDYFGDLVRVCTLSFVPATVCAGTVLPLLLAEIGGSPGPASPEVGRRLALNTAGCIAGPLVTTFGLFPTLGLWGSAVALGWGQLALPFVLPALRRRVPSSAALALTGLAALLSWQALALPRVRVEAGRGEELVWLREGSHGIASVIRDPGGLRLKLDNFYTLGGSATPGDARMLGHLPLLAHGAPRRVAFLGLGTGITASACLAHEVEEVTLFELSPEVAVAARSAFGAENRRLLEDPRVTLVVDDALSHLRTSPGRYDVIVGDLVVPWRRGEAALFTREHFRDVRRALASGGLFCQWLPLYQMSEQEFRIVAATFLDVFPAASVWRGDFVAARPTLALFGWAGDAGLSLEAIDRRASALRDALSADSRYLAHPAGVWLHLVGGLGRETPWLAGVPRNTLDHPWLELQDSRARLSADPRGPRWFTGAPLLAFLEEFHAGGTGRDPLALDAGHQRWRDLGEALFEASCLDADGREEAARSLAFGVLGELPREIQESVLGPGSTPPEGKTP